MPEELWTKVHNIVREAVTKTIPDKKKFKKAKWLSQEALQIAEERREVKGKGERERYPTECRFQSIARRDKKAFLTIQRNRRKQLNGKDWRSLQENWSYQGNISCKDGHDKGQKQ